MPEGVEVTLTALFLDNELKNNILLDITILSGRYTKKRMTGLEIFSRNKPYIVDYVNSKGKFLWFNLYSSKSKQNYYIFNHFGMTGEWGYQKQKNSRIMLTFKNTQNNTMFDMFYTDDRNFGTMRFSNNTNELNYEINKLAPDFLKQNFTNNDFHNRIKHYLDYKTDKNIANILLNQKDLGSGLGMYLVTEILFYARISPYKLLSDIYNNKNLSNKLAKSIKYITKLAFLTSDVGYLSDLEPEFTNFITKLRNNIYTNPNYKYNFHPDIKIKKNTIFDFEIYRQKYDPYGNPIIMDKNLIKGRTIYWSPKIQS